MVKYIREIRSLVKKDCVGVTGWVKPVLNGVYCLL